MVDKLLLTYLLVDVLFLGSGALLAYVAISTQREINHGPTIDTVARDVLLDHAPLSATLANAVMIFLTFVISLPALAMPTNRAWLRLHGFLVVFSALFTLVIGLVVWHMTLQTRANLSVMWDAQPAQIQSFLQQKFNCCGYLNSFIPPYQQDAVCTSASVASLKPGCIGPFSDFANGYLNILFTTCFSIVALDVILLLFVAMVLKSRREKERYQLIDAKNGFTAI